MSFIKIVPFTVGELEVSPRYVSLVTGYDLTTITTAGFLNQTNLAPSTLYENDNVFVTYSATTERGPGTNVICTVTISNGSITLSPLPSGANKISGTVGANNIAAFADSTGTLTYPAGGATATLRSNLQLGNTGNLGYLRLYPGTANGYLQITPATNAGNHAVTITNASVGQPTTYTFPDPGASANVVVAPGALVVGNLVKAASINGALSDLGSAPLYGKTPSWGGGSASNAFTVNGMVSTNIISGAIIYSSSNSVSINKVVPGTNTLTITFSGDPGAGTVVSYDGWLA